MRLTHPDPDVPDVHAPNLVGTLQAFQGQGYELAHDVELMDPADPSKPVAANASEPAPRKRARKPAAGT